MNDQIIKPTIGRVVLLKNSAMSDQMLPALICYVFDDNCINIGGFDSNGGHFLATNVFLCQGDQEPSEGQACWMPFQRKYAAERVAAGLDSQDTVSPTEAVGEGSKPVE